MTFFVGNVMQNAPRLSLTPNNDRGKTSAFVFLQSYNEVFMGFFLRKPKTLTK